jgi:hypothetical protein
MLFKEMVEQLTSELGVETPKWNQQKVCTVSINPALSVSFRELVPGFSLYSLVCPCPTLKREELFLLLMRANFLGQGTGGARIGLDENEKVLTLSIGFTYEMNYQLFKESVEDFVNYVIYWRDEIAKFEREK